MKGRSIEDVWRMTQLLARDDEKDDAVVFDGSISSGSHRDAPDDWGDPTYDTENKDLCPLDPRFWDQEGCMELLSDSRNNE